MWIIYLEANDVGHVCRNAYGDTFCVFMDIQIITNVSKTYQAGDWWDKYTHTSYSLLLSCFFRRAYYNAFAKWAEVADLNFREVSGNQDADIVISYGRYHHGDNAPFDGRGTRIAISRFCLSCFSSFIYCLGYINDRTIFPHILDNHWWSCDH